jgi:hypothetical protein
MSIEQVKLDGEEAVGPVPVQPNQRAFDSGVKLVKVE